MITELYARTARWSVAYNPNNQEVIFEGIIRPQNEQQAARIKHTIIESTKQTSGTLYITLKKLRNINAVGLKTLADSLMWIAENRADLKVKLVVTSVVAWSMKEIGHLAQISPKFTVEQYDKSFYPGQSFGGGDA